nr:zinc finger, CCHC-type [Tanacetum cinerariifolium]
MASIKKGMLEPVKVKCIFLVYHKNIVGNKLWRLDDVTSKVVLYRNMSFNEYEEYKKTFIGYSVGTGSVQVLDRFEFKVEPLGDHTFEVEPQENVDQGAGLQEVQTQDLIYYHLARDREQHLACELFGYRENINEVAFAVVVVEKIYAHESPTFNNTVASTVAGNAVTTTMAINGSIHQKLVQTLLEGHSVLSLKGSLSRDCDVEENGSLKANLQHMEALSTTEAGYMTFTEAWKKKM